jgi:hypothetical protein
VLTFFSMWKAQWTEGCRRGFGLLEALVIGA